MRVMVKAWNDVTIHYESKALTIENPFKNSNSEWGCVLAIPETQKAEAGDEIHWSLWI